MEYIRKNIGQRVLLGIIAIFTVNNLAMWLQWYSSMWWFDIPMHFVGGFWLAVFVIWIGFKRFSILLNNKKYLRFFFLTMLFVFVSAVGWELFEFSIDMFTHFSLQNIPDSISDLCFGVAGAMLGIVYVYNKFNRLK